MDFRRLADSATQTFASKIITDGAGVYLGSKVAQKIGVNKATGGAIGGIATDIISNYVSATDKITNSLKSLSKSVSKYISNETIRIQQQGRVINSYVKRH